MGKYSNDIMGMFDGVNLPSSEKPTENGVSHIKVEPLSGEERTLNDYGYLQIVLEIQRNFDRQREQNLEILENQKDILKRLEECKGMKVSLSPTDIAVLTKLPRLISEEVNRNLGEAANNIMVSITQHAESTLRSVNETCDRRVGKAKKELGFNKGIFLSWWNFWSLLLTTVISVSYATYDAFNKCMWNELWERLWLPFLTSVGFIGMVCLNVWLNYRDIKDTRL